MIEACLAMAMICLVFFGLFQVSQVFAAREILSHAAARGARAKTVGLNGWMVTKSVRVASIPNAGKLIEPAFQNDDPFLRGMINTLKPGELWDTVVRDAEPSSLQYQLEAARIPDYLYSDNAARAAYVLDYDRWDTIDRHITEAANQLRVTIGQEYQLWVPLHRVYYNRDTVSLSAEAWIENHYPLYLNDFSL